MRSLFIAGRLLLILSSWSSVVAQNSLYWDMQQPSPTGTVSSLLVSSLVQGNNFGNTAFYTNLSPSQSYTGASGSVNVGVACRTGNLTIGTSGSAYIGVTLSPASGYRLRILSIAFGSRSTSSGPARWSLFSSADHFVHSLSTAVLPVNSTWTRQQSVDLSLSSLSPLELRIYGHDGVGTPAINVANWRLDDLTIHYQIEAISLPVDWLYVRYAIKEDSVQLEWATVVEINNKEFQVERSIDGQHFASFAIIPSSGDHGGTQLQYYSVLDRVLPQPLIFYRIKQVDKDGTSSYSPTVLVRNDKAALVPTPDPLWFDHASANISISVKPAMGVTVCQLYNARGQLVRKKELYPVSLNANSLYTLYAGDLPNGIYYLVLVSARQRSKGRPILIY